jgi:hypothetical protein
VQLAISTIAIRHDLMITSICATNVRNVLKVNAWSFNSFKIRELAHVTEKWTPVFRKEHAPPKEK